MPAWVALSELVGQLAAEHGAKHGAQAACQTKHQTGVRNAHAMDADEKAGCPHAVAITCNTRHAAGQADIAQRLHAKQATHLLEHRFARRVGYWLGLGRFICTTHRLFDEEKHQQRQNHARNTEGQKHRAPAVVLRHHAADHQTQQGAQVGAHHEQADGEGAHLGWVGIGHDGNRRRHATGFPHGHAHAGNQHMPVLGGKAAGGGGQTPDAAAHRHDVAAVLRIRHAPHRNAQQRVDQAKRQPGEQAHLRIGGAKFMLDRFQQN